MRCADGGVIHIRARSTDPVSRSRRARDLPNRTRCALDAAHVSADTTVPATVEPVPFGSSSPSTEETGSGAVSLKRASPAKRRGSPVSTRSSASERSAIPHSSWRVEPARRVRWCSSRLGFAFAGVELDDGAMWSSSSRSRSAVTGSHVKLRSRSPTLARHPPAHHGRRR
jgi:hypothetical protein